MGSGTGVHTFTLNRTEGESATRTCYRRIVHWLSGEEGQDLIEYGLLAFLISAALVVVLTLVAPPLLTLFSHIVSAFP